MTGWWPTESSRRRKSVWRVCSCGTASTSMAYIWKCHFYMYAIKEKAAGQVKIFHRTAWVCRQKLHFIGRFFQITVVVGNGTWVMGASETYGTLQVAVNLIEIVVSRARVSPRLFVAFYWSFPWNYSSCRQWHTGSSGASETYGTLQVAVNLIEIVVSRARVSLRLFVSFYWSFLSNYSSCRQWHTGSSGASETYGTLQVAVNLIEIVVSRARVSLRLFVSFYWSFLSNYSSCRQWHTGSSGASETYGTLQVAVNLIEIVVSRARVSLRLFVSFYWSFLSNYSSCRQWHTGSSGASETYGTLQVAVNLIEIVVSRARVSLRLFVSFYWSFLSNYSSCRQWHTGSSGASETYGTLQVAVNLIEIVVSRARVSLRLFAAFYWSFPWNYSSCRQWHTGSSGASETYGTLQVAVNLIEIVVSRARVSLRLFVSFYWSFLSNYSSCRQWHTGSSGASETYGTLQVAVNLIEIVVSRARVSLRLFVSFYWSFLSNYSSCRQWHTGSSGASETYGTLQVAVNLIEIVVSRARVSLRLFVSFYWSFLSNYSSCRQWHTGSSGASETYGTLQVAVNLIEIVVSRARVSLRLFVSFYWSFLSNYSSCRQWHTGSSGASETYGTLQVAVNLIEIVVSRARVSPRLFAAFYWSFPWNYSSCRQWHTGSSGASETYGTLQVAVNLIEIVVSRARVSLRLFVSFYWSFLSNYSSCRQWHTGSSGASETYGTLQVAVNLIEIVVSRARVSLRLFVSFYWSFPSNYSSCRQWHTGSSGASETYGTLQVAVNLIEIVVSRARVSLRLFAAFYWSFPWNYSSCRQWHTGSSGASETYGTLQVAVNLIEIVVSRARVSLRLFVSFYWSFLSNYSSCRQWHTGSSGASETYGTLQVAVNLIEIVVSRARVSLRLFVSFYWSFLSNYSSCRQWHTGSSGASETYGTLQVAVNLIEIVVSRARVSLRLFVSFYWSFLSNYSSCRQWHTGSSGASETYGTLQVAVNLIEIVVSRARVSPRLFAAFYWSFPWNYSSCRQWHTGSSGASETYGTLQVAVNLIEIVVSRARVSLRLFVSFYWSFLSNYSSCRQWHTGSSGASETYGTLQVAVNLIEIVVSRARVSPRLFAAFYWSFPWNYSSCRQWHTGSSGASETYGTLQVAVNLIKIVVGRARFFGNSLMFFIKKWDIKIQIVIFKLIKIGIQSSSVNRDYQNVRQKSLD